MRPTRLFLTVNAVAAALNCVRTPVLTMDSIDYQTHLLYRPPVTSLVLDLARLFGPLQLRAFVAMQMLLGVFSSFRLARALTRAAGIEAFALTAATFYVLFAPHLQHGTVVMSDSLAYSFVALAVAHALDCVHAPNGRALVACAAASVVAVATRSQLLFLLPLAIAAVALFVFCAADRRCALKPAALALGLVAAFGLIQPSYNAIFNGRFVSVKAGGVHWLAVVLYVTEPADLDVLLDGPERRFATALYERAHGRGLLRSQIPLYMPESHHFDRYFDALAWTTVGQTYCDLVLQRPVGSDAGHIVRAMSPDEWQAFDRFTSHIAAQLLRRSGGRYVGHIVTCARQFAGVGLMMTLLLGAVGLARLRRDRERAALLVVTTGLWLGNLLVISLVQDLRYRYTFPFDAMLAATTLVCGWSFLDRRSVILAGDASSAPHLSRDHVGRRAGAEFADEPRRAPGGGARAGKV